MIVFHALLVATALAQDPRYPPPTPSAPERAKGTAITFGGKSTEEVLPNPYRFEAPPDRVSEAVQQVVKDAELEMDGQKTKPRGGIFVTTWCVFAKGINARSELLRVADLPSQEIHNWTIARYRLEIRVNLVETNVSLVTVNVEVQGFSQDLTASTWTSWHSKGIIENNLLRLLRDLIEK